MMLPAISSAVSGMRVATLRLEASARNVAAASSARAPHVYVLVPPSPPVPSPAPAGATAPVRNVSATWMASYAPDAGSDGAADLIGETMEMAMAESSFIANARTLETAQAMVKRLFDLAD